ncbi:hypothetical protein AVKW3434_21905 [Acidovorax sp. SUPP3434]|nr:hypothetical protein AVKW3434_21905 [Acidovorax sp. SUPP3434]
MQTPIPTPTPPASGDAFLFSGNRHETVPRRLFLDRRLTPLERNAWQVFRLMLNDDGVTAFPTYEQLRPWLASMPCAGQASHETVARALTLLRLTRWLSLVRRRRDPKTGRILGNLYVLHDEPLTPFEAMQLDADYLALVSQSLGHSARAVQMVGLNTLKEIAEDPLLSGRTLPSRLQVLAERLASQGVAASQCFAMRDELIALAQRQVLPQACGHPFHLLPVELAQQTTGAGTTFLRWRRHDRSAMGVALWQELVASTSTPINLLTDLHVIELQRITLNMQISLLHTLGRQAQECASKAAEADDAYRSSTPRDGWPYDSNRDAGLAQVASGGGYPTCRQWWADGSNGLRARLLGQVDPSLLNRLAGWAGFLSRAEVDDSVIRAIASPRQQKLNQGSVYTDYGGQIDKTLPNIVTRATGDVGMAVGAIAAFPAMDVARQALPMALALLKMALVICIPLVLVVGTYDLKTVVTVSVVQFALFFVDFWFQLARWIDSTILDALYGWGFGWNRPHTNFDPLVGLNNAFGDMLLNFVTGTMFLVLPTFWVAALGWVGVKAGVIAQNLAVGSKEARDSAGLGVNKVAGKVL